MSHVSKVELIISDLGALGKAAPHLGMELVKQSTYRWFGSWVNDYHGEDAAYKHGIKPEDYGKCEYVLRIKDNAEAYEVGLVRRADGQGWDPIFDFWAGGRGLQAVIGEGACNVKREYALQVGMREMARKGFRTERVINQATNRPRMRAWR